jgi:hypothetical protein
VDFVHFAAHEYSHGDAAHLGHQGGLAVALALRRLDHEPQRRLAGMVAYPRLTRSRRDHKSGKPP